MGPSNAIRVRITNIRGLVRCPPSLDYLLDNTCGGRFWKGGLDYCSCRLLNKRTKECSCKTKARPHLLRLLIASCCDWVTSYNMYITRPDYTIILSAAMSKCSLIWRQYLHQRCFDISMQITRKVDPFASTYASLFCKYGCNNINNAIVITPSALFFIIINSNNKFIATCCRNIQTYRLLSSALASLFLTLYELRAITNAAGNSRVSEVDSDSNMSDVRVNWGTVKGLIKLQ